VYTITISCGSSLYEVSNGIHEQTNLISSHHPSITHTISNSSQSMEHWEQNINMEIEFKQVKKITKNSTKTNSTSSQSSATSNFNSNSNSIKNSICTSIPSIDCASLLDMNSNSDNDSDCYSMKSLNGGLCILIRNSHFSDPKLVDLIAYEVDEPKLIHLFQHLIATNII
jgi:hypothetical protein